MDGDSLRELLESATNASASTPGNAGLLASLLPKKNKSVSSSPIASPVSISSSAHDNAAMAVSQSIQELSLNAIRMETTTIAQVRASSQKYAQWGDIISATKHYITYLLNDRKIRIISQENAATTLLDCHDPNSLPVVDMAWNASSGSGESGPGAAGIYAPRQHYLASLTRGGELCIGHVYPESSKSLVYEALCATTFPELNPARGISWNDDEERPIIAVYGDSPEIYLMSIHPKVRTAALTTELASIESVKFFDKGDKLAAVSLEKAVIFSIRSIEETFDAQIIPLPEGLCRVWLFNHEYGALLVGIQSQSSSQLQSQSSLQLNEIKLVIIPFFGEASEVFISMPLPSDQPESLFAAFDQVTNVLCVGAVHSPSLVCIQLTDLSSPILSAGSWIPSAFGVYSATQLHSIFDKGATEPYDMHLYAYHADAVKLHSLHIDWSYTTSHKEPITLPLPNEQFLRPLRSPSTHALPHSPSGSQPLSPPAGFALNAAGIVAANSAGIAANTANTANGASVPVRPSSTSSVPLHQSPSLTPSSTLNQNDGLVREVVAAVKKQLDYQGAQIRKDRREAELMESRRQQELLAQTIQGIQQAVLGNLQTVIRQESTAILNAILPASLDTNMDRLNHIVGQKVEHVVGKSLGQPEKLMDGLSVSLANALGSTIDGSLRESFEGKFIPALQSILSDLIGQLSANVTQAIVDSTIEQYKLMMAEMGEVRKVLLELHHQVMRLPTAKDLAETVTNELRTSLPTMSPAAMRHPVEMPEEVKTPLDEINDLLAKGRSVDALVLVLEACDLEQLNWFLGQVEPSSVVESPELTPNVVVSLIQQIGTDLSSATDVKLAWLAEIFTVLDPNVFKSVEIIELIPSVLEDLFANLRILFTSTAASSPTNKTIKTVMRLVRLAM